MAHTAPTAPTAPTASPAPRTSASSSAPDAPRTSAASSAPIPSAAPTPPITYGYARVSARDQNLDRQLDALADFGVDPAHILADKASGKNFDRPAYRKLMRRLKRGDTLVITSIDRLGRNYDEILSEWRRITKERGAAIVVLDMPLLDTRGRTNGDGTTSENDLTGAFIADIVLQLLSYVAQIERENIHRRQEQGIAAAKARGVRFGRPAKQRPATYPAVKKAYLNGYISRAQAAKRLGVCARTFAKWLEEDLEDGQPEQNGQPGQGGQPEQGGQARQNTQPKQNTRPDQKSPSAQDDKPTQSKKPGNPAR